MSGKLQNPLVTLEEANLKRKYLQKLGTTLDSAKSAIEVPIVFKF